MKITKRLGDIVASTEKESKMIRRRNASLGNLLSSATFNEILSCWLESFADAGDVITAEVGWVIEESLRVGNDTKLKLIENAKTHFGDLVSAAKLDLEETAKIIGEPKLLSRNLPSIGQKMEAELGGVIAGIEGSVVAAKNRGIKGLVNLIFGWLSKLIGK